MDRKDGCRTRILLKSLGHNTYITLWQYWYWIRYSLLKYCPNLSPWYVCVLPTGCIPVQYGHFYFHKCSVFKTVKQQNHCPWNYVWLQIWIETCIIHWPCLPPSLQLPDTRDQSLFLCQSFVLKCNETLLDLPTNTALHPTVVQYKLAITLSIPCQEFNSGIINQKADQLDLCYFSMY